VFDLVDVFDIWCPMREAENQRTVTSKVGVDHSYRVSLVESALVTSLGRLERKAPKQLIVRGI